MTKPKAAQLRLEVRLYRVKANRIGDLTIQAASRSAAKYRFYKLAREAGHFSQGFREFLANGFTAREVRR